MIIRSKLEFSNFLEKLIDISETAGYKYCNTIEWNNDKLRISNKELSKTIRSYLINATSDNLENLKNHYEPLIISIMVERKKFLSHKHMHWRISNLSAIEILSSVNYNKYVFMKRPLYLYEINTFGSRDKQTDEYTKSVLEKLKTLDV